MSFSLQLTLDFLHFVPWTCYALCSSGSLHKLFLLSGVFSPSFCHLMPLQPGCLNLNVTSVSVTDTTRAPARSIWFHSPQRRGREVSELYPRFTGYLCQGFTQEYKQGPVATHPLAFSESCCQEPGLENCWAGGPLMCPPGIIAKILHTQGDTESSTRRGGGGFVCTLLFVMDTAGMCRLWWAISFKGHCFNYMGSFVILKRAPQKIVL